MSEACFLKNICGIMKLFWIFFVNVQSIFFESESKYVVFCVLKWLVN